MYLEAYRESAEEFVAELTAEFYRHYAGLKEEFEIEAVYARHDTLFTREAVEELREQAAVPAPGTDERRRRRMLLEFAVEGHLGQATKAIDAELARREAELSIEVDGERIGYRESTVVQANEPDADRRERIEQARLTLTEHELNPLHRESLERQHELAVELGYPSYRDMCSALRGLDFEALHRQTEAFSAATESSYAEVVEPELRRTLGIGFDGLRRSDLPRFFRDVGADASFPADLLTQSFIETARGLGIEVTAQPGVILDTERRPKKSPRAFCAPVRAPGEVYLVIAPVGGRDDFSTLFHEGGHTEHFANVDPALPFEFRQLGDNAITEAYAFLFQHLIEDPEWLRRRLGVDDDGALASYARANRLVYLRRYTAKFAYELELHSADATDGDGLDALADRYAELLSAAVRVEWPRQTFLADVDPGFYCTAYLRAWALETHLRAHFRRRFGPAWFENPEAGEALRSLWHDGQRLTPEEMLRELTGERLDFTVLRADLGLD
jgi:oligoendopeptidase F